ncbi:MAG: ATP-binding cassette domain-containing protein, partial [Actinobacteria bacterium]|nr:ATP-binding cassette domain-containing protein [Actinomycetota bacterium]
LRETSMLRVENLVQEFSVPGGKVSAVADVSIDVADGETLGLVGESGCGKSTFGKAVMRIVKPTAGRVTVDGVELTNLSRRQLRHTRPTMQLIFQDPISSLNPRLRVAELLGEPLSIWDRGTKAERDTKVAELLEVVGLDPAASLTKRPHEFSGGQCQRLSVARALILEPKVLICDEPVSALDVSVQAQLLNLVQDMKARYRLTMVFISHDLAVVKNVSDRIAVMYLGKLCEIAPSDRLYAAPKHPYTAALLKSIPVPDPTIRPEPVQLVGDVPSPIDPPSGCRFRTRCTKATEVCATEEPAMVEIDTDHYVACHWPN